MLIKPRRVSGLLALSLVALAWPAVPRPAHADGCFVWKNEKVDITEPEQKAVIAFKDGWEELTLEVKYEGPPDEFGWIVPLPARPTLSLGRARLFTSLSMRTQEPRVGRCRAAWGLRATLGGIESDPRVTVLERRQVGIYDAAILGSTSGAVLSDWLRTNAFRAPPHAEAVFDDYARRGWVFVALKIPPAAVDSTTGAKLAAGTIQPIRFRFPTPAPVFPLRISSLNRGPTDILIYLLANDQFVHATCRKAEWEERMCGPMRLEYVDPDSHFAADGQPTFFVSKLRARLKPEQMEDLTFAPYDAVAGLNSADLQTRIEAASYVGFARRASGLPALLRFVAGCRRDTVEYVPMTPGQAREDATGKGQDLRSALWALEEIGSPEAVPVLLRWADGPPSETTLEAFDSLARMNAREALPLCVERLHATTRRDRYDFISAVLGSTAYEMVVRLGDPGCLPRLRELSLLHAASPELTAPDEDNVEWPLSPDEAGPRILIARLACGDPEARVPVMRAILDGSVVTRTDRMLVDAARGGSANGYPSGIRVGMTLLAEGEATAGFWRPLSAVLGGLKSRPALRDTLLRAAAADSGTPPLGRTLLLGLLAAPEERDRRALDALWSEAIAVPAVARVPVDIGLQHGDSFENYNLPACAVVYAFTRWRDAPSLRRLWSACPPADATLRAEIALGLGTCAQPEDLSRLVEYVRRDWAARVATTEFVTRLEARADDRSIGLRGLSIDVDYRSRALHHYFRTIVGGPEALRQLIRDGSVAPAVRLECVTIACGDIRRVKAVAPDLLEAVKEIEAEAGAGSSLARAAGSLGRLVEWWSNYRPKPD